MELKHKKDISSRELKKRLKYISRVNLKEKLTRSQYGFKLFLCPWCFNPVYSEIHLDNTHAYHQCCMFEMIRFTNILQRGVLKKAIKSLNICLEDLKKEVRNSSHDMGILAIIL